MGVLFLEKNKVVNIRIRSKQYEKIKDLGFTFADCFQLGYERICENEREELEKLDQKYYNMYIRVHTKLENFGKKLDNEQKEIQRLYEWFTKQDRDINDPNNQDIQALKLQMEKRKIHSFNVEQVIERFKEIKEDI